MRGARWADLLRGLLLPVIAAAALLMFAAALSSLDQFTTPSSRKI